MGQYAGWVNEFADGALLLRADAHNHGNDDGQGRDAVNEVAQEQDRNRNPDHDFQVGGPWLDQHAGHLAKQGGLAHGGPHYEHGCHHNDRVVHQAGPCFPEVQDLCDLQNNRDRHGGQVYLHFITQDQDDEYYKG